MSRLSYRPIGLVLATIVSATALGPAMAIERPFGQEDVPTRPYRTPQKLEGHSHGHGHHHHGHDGHSGGHDHGVETENLFGFTLGSDVDEAGARSLALESVVLAGRRDGRFRTLGAKLEFAYAPIDGMSFSASVLGAHAHVAGVTGFADTRTGYAWNGLGAEWRWRLLDRKSAPFGLTLHVEPSYRRYDEASGLPGRGFGSENKLILDQELVPDRVFGALNITYDIERFRERGATTSERGSTVGLGAAASVKVTEGVFLGFEAQYMRAYDGYFLRRYAGQALFAGPTLHARLPGSAWMSLAWNAQVAGRAAGASGARLDLENFSRHRLRLKLGFEF
ncbi:MAG: hypothetical protein IPL88_11975 [Rhizobiales bacterium]|nr:hypothetical protein [Hyphomicrobiales bacterium]